LGEAESRNPNTENTKGNETEIFERIGMFGRGRRGESRFIPFWLGGIGKKIRIFIKIRESGSILIGVVFCFNYII
jgi:hypothetical protein